MNGHPRDQAKVSVGAYMTGGRSSEGRLGGAKRNTPYTTRPYITTSDIDTEYNVIQCE